ncbi:hypothetical protein ACM39_18320 [Chryseobacterium sp. FH2]|uniref:hypothetical protein n=1 Tax=Chryseobacterium sp. FH2 TaxID=1674291 RepID=UPI00065AE96D|nr:hypothetical protein [Chryseobacterium sp. FH2]KMQ59916.1 hypothetical protein ACM39_18320 [Chryseobacterium sp. FH2]
MNKPTALEKLKAMANEPKDSLKKFLAKDEPLDFFSLVKKFGMKTIYHYEDYDEEVMREFYNTYSTAITQIQQEDNVQHQTDTEHSWYALERSQV